MRLVSYLWGCVTGALLAYAVVFCLALLAGCVDSVERHVDPDRNRCEIEAELRGAECATVFAFAEPWPNELGHVELCVPDRYLDEAQARHGVAWPSDSERFTQYTMGLVEPPCLWACPGIVGANAFNGAYVPVGGCP